MKEKVDQTVARLVSLIKETVPSAMMDGYKWYDVSNQGLEAEVKELRDLEPDSSPKQT